MDDLICEIIEKYSDMVFRIALHNVGNYSDAEDIMQEVFLKCYMNKKIAEYGTDRIKAWLIRVTLNQCKDLHKSAWYKRRDQNELCEGQFTQLTNPGIITEEYLDMLEGLKKLSFKERNIIYLEFLGYSYKEIAQFLHMNPNSVPARLRKAQKIIHDYMR